MKKRNILLKYQIVTLLEYDCSSSKYLKNSYSSDTSVYVKNNVLFIATPAVKGLKLIKT